MSATVRGRWLRIEAFAAGQRSLPDYATTTGILRANGRARCSCYMPSRKSSDSRNICNACFCSACNIMPHEQASQSMRQLGAGV